MTNIISPIGIQSEDMLEEMDRMFSADRTQETPCVRCGAPFIPGMWFFYGLCDYCFKLFDFQKMMGRLSMIFGKKRFKDATESAKEWTLKHPFVSREADDTYYFSLQTTWDKVMDKKKPTVH